MNDPLVVRGGENVEDLVGDEQRACGVETPALGLRDDVERVALEELHDEERAPVGCSVVVEHPHRAGMVHAIRDVALPEKSPAHLLVARARVPEDLDRTAEAIAVRRSEYSGHSADANQRVEVPLVEKSRPHERGGFLTKVVGHAFHVTQPCTDCTAEHARM